MLSKCIQISKYSFKRNLFLPYWGGGCDTYSGLPTTPHMHHMGSTTHHVGLTMHCVVHTTPLRTNDFIICLIFNRGVVAIFPKGSAILHGEGSANFHPSGSMILKKILIFYYLSDFQ